MIWTMQDAIGIATLLLSLLLLWSGRRKLQFSSLGASLLSVFEVCGIVLAALSLGWLGYLLLAAINVAGFLSWSVVLAMHQEKILTYAAIQADESKESMEDLARWLGRQHELRAMGPIQRAELIKLLAERARSIEEIKLIAVPVGMLWLVHEPPLEWLVESFDRLLRLAGEPAQNAMKVADTITAGTQRSAATFSEMEEALLAAYDPVELDDAA